MNDIYAKPILGKYNEGNFRYLCDSVGKENRMDWDNIQNFQEEGNEIDSQSMSLQRLGNLLDNEMKHQIIESKKV